MNGNNLLGEKIGNKTNEVKYTSNDIYWKYNVLQWVGKCTEWLTKAMSISLLFNRTYITMTNKPPTPQKTCTGQAMLYIAIRHLSNIKNVFMQQSILGLVKVRTPQRTSTENNTVENGFKEIVS